MAKITIYLKGWRDSALFTDAVNRGNHPRHDEAMVIHDQIFQPYKHGHVVFKAFEYEDEGDDNTILNAAFERFNVGDDDIARKYRRLKLRSLSVGDVVVIAGPGPNQLDDRAYGCDSVGWTPILNFDYWAQRADDDEFRIACLGPEPTPVSKSTGSDGSFGDGYDFIAKSDEAGMWHTHGSWGLDGWDLGAWPLVIVQTAQEGTGDDATWLVRTRVEGDIDVWRFRTQEEAHAKVDHIAWFYWLNEPSSYGADTMTHEVMGADVARFRGPFTWARLDESKES